MFFQLAQRPLTFTNVFLIIVIIYCGDMNILTQSSIQTTASSPKSGPRSSHSRSSGPASKPVVGGVRKRTHPDYSPPVSGWTANETLWSRDSIMIINSMKGGSVLCFSNTWWFSGCEKSMRRKGANDPTSVAQHNSASKCVLGIGDAGETAMIHL